MSMWQHLCRTIAESAGAGVRMIPTEYRCRWSSSNAELHCGLCLQDQQKVGTILSHDQCATVLRTVGGLVRIWQFSVLRNRGQNAVQCVLVIYKRQLIQLNKNESGLLELEWKTRDPCSLVDDSLVTRTHCIVTVHKKKIAVSAKKTKGTQSTGADSDSNMTYPADPNL